MKFDADTLSRAWLSVAHASGSDSERPALDRTICVETFDNGVRLVATDSYVLLHAWVAATGEDPTLEPEPDEAPTSIAVVRDTDGRGKGLFGHLLKLAEDEHTPPFTIDMSVGAGIETTQGAFDGLEAEWLVVEHPDHERLKLHTYDGSYPRWRAVVAGFAAKSTSAIAISPDMAARLAKVGKIHPNASLRWRFGGVNKMASIEIDGYPVINGFVMPVRWDFDRNEARPEKVKKSDEDGE